MMRNQIPIIKKGRSHKDRIAIIDKNGMHHYAGLIEMAGVIASRLLNEGADLNCARIAFMVSPNFDYVAVQWGIWLAGGIAVPICISHPDPEIAYVIKDVAAGTIICQSEFKNRLSGIAKTLNIPLLTVSDIRAGTSHSLPDIKPNRAAMILYTSGTTSRPKGVVTTHENITAQIKSLVKAWGWTKNDHILHVLPLHHTHGIINVLSCALWAGATCEMIVKFEPEIVWKTFIEHDLTLFMAVPTTYVKLIETWEKRDEQEQKQMTDACQKFRLMVSGSAALPKHVFDKWRLVSGQTLLERYGMTEIGMALSNPLNGERRVGHVGSALPGVKIRLIDDSDREIKEEDVQGEIQVKGKTVFKEYWHKPEETSAVFKNGWFCTGDIATIKDGYFRILGRKSVDIIKTGGYKVSALEIEEVLRSHPDIKECAVIGMEDAEWGERVCAGVVLGPASSMTFEDLRKWTKQRLASYKTPSKVLFLDQLPTNVMGKVNKPAIKKMFC